MIFKAHELDKNLEKFNFFLLHGVNEGHKEEIINKFKELYEENIFKYYEKYFLTLMYFTIKYYQNLFLKIKN